MSTARHQRSAAAERLERRRLLAGDFAFAHAVGGSGRDRAGDVAVGADGDVYVTGQFSRTVGFDPFSTTQQNRTAAGGDDAFVARYAPSGALRWVRTFGGTSNEEGMALAVDRDGNAIVTGFFYGKADFDPGPGVKEYTSKGAADAFVVKFDGAGNLAWAKRFAGSADSGGTAVAADGAGNVYAMGMFTGTIDLNPNSGSVNATSKGDLDVYVAKLTAAGAFAWGKSFGGSGKDSANGVAVGGPDGHVRLAGSFRNSVDFNPGSGTRKLSSAGGIDAFVSKLTASGGSFVSAVRLGGSGTDQARDLAVDAAGNVVVVGDFTGAADFDPGSGTTRLTSAGDSDMFIVKLDAGSNLSWAVRRGGGKRDRATDVALDAGGNVHVTGEFAGTFDFNPGSETNNLTSANDSADGFVLKLTGAGAFAWAQRVGGAGVEVGEGIALDAARNVFSIGRFNGTADFDPGAATRSITSAGDDDGFLLKLLA